MSPLHVLLTAFVGWVNREQHAVIEYLTAENLVLKAHFAGDASVYPMPNGDVWRSSAPGSGARS